MSSTDTERGYVLGTGEDELLRLGFQHRLWSESAHAIWERAGIAPGHAVLDLGCGPGFATLDLAQLVTPAGRVVAVDESPRFLEYLRTQLDARRVTHVDVVHGDAQKLELPPGSFDRAYTRWVLCFVPDPAALVANVARALKPGGVWAVQDYYRYTAITLASPSDAFRRVIQAVDASWRQPGGDPEVGTRLPRMMTEHGLRIREVRPLVRAARPGEALWEWPASFFRNFLPVLVGKGLITGADADAFRRDWDEHTRDPGAFFCTPPMVDIIASKA